MRQLSFRAFTLLLACAAILGLGACAIHDIWQEEAADRLASPAHMLKRLIDTDSYRITTYQRIHEKYGEAVVYIEGDAIKYAGKTVVSTNPTPDYPLALHLATRDLSDNVIYMARPCQYEKVSGADHLCAKETWTTNRFSLDAMESMNAVLDQLKKSNGFSGFHLVGYDGGGTVAALLAAKRKDVLSLRTVAGVLDTDTHNAYHTQPLLPPGTLNPRDFAKDLAHIPQHHFIGAWDEEVTPKLSENFRGAMGPSSCLRISTVDEVDHEGGWVNRWPSLLKEPVDCAAQ